MDKKEQYKKWLLETFNIEVTKNNEKYFYGVISVHFCNNNYCSKVLAFKGDPLISFMICDRSMDEIKLTNDRKLTNFTRQKEYFITDDFLANTFNHYELQRFTDHNDANPVGQDVKSACIEALIYATYKSFDIKKAWEVWNIILKDMEIKIILR